LTLKNSLCSVATSQLATCNLQLAVYSAYWCWPLATELQRANCAVSSAANQEAQGSFLCAYKQHAQAKCPQAHNPQSTIKGHWLWSWSLLRMLVSVSVSAGFWFLILVLNRKLKKPKPKPKPKTQSHAVTLMLTLTLTLHPTPHCTLHG
jgi:hypothetical protein